ncbi:MAG: nucleoside monophosphate kinase [archaeon]|nr:nucleoside monophosphate kinase [archaeon]
MKLVILGPPGSGKGTVASRLAKDFHLKHLSIGQLLREEACRKTKSAKEISKFINKGDLVPNQMSIDLVKKQVKKNKNYILDGFPRAIGQAEGTKDLDIDLVIYLEVSEKDTLERLGKRRTDPLTGKTYHLIFLPPPKNIIKRLIKRKDDTPKAIKERLNVFNKETKPVLKYFKIRGMLKKVNGAQTPDKVYAAVKKAVEEL